MRSIALKSSAFGLVLAVLTNPVVANACAVCFSNSEQNRDAYLGMTIVMSLLPLSLIFGGIYWVYRQYKKAELAEAAETHLDAAPAAP